MIPALIAAGLTPAESGSSVMVAYGATRSMELTGSFENGSTGCCRTDTVENVVLTSSVVE
jgi:hypothetical protein